MQPEPALGAIGKIALQGFTHGAKGELVPRDLMLVKELCLDGFRAGVERVSCKRAR